MFAIRNTFTLYCMAMGYFIPIDSPGVLRVKDSKVENAYLPMIGFLWFLGA